MNVLKPVWLIKAEGEIGVYEYAGENDNHPRIVEYLGSVNGNMFIVDEVAWCSAFMCFVMEQSLFASTESLLARSWLTWGRKLNAPTLGAIAVLERGQDSWQGHVGLVTDWDDNRIKLLGGNQSNQVNEQWFSREKVLGYRWPLVIKSFVTAPKMIKKKQLEYIGEQERRIENTPLRIKVPFYEHPKFVALVKSVGDVVLGVLSLLPKTSLLGKGLVGVKNALVKDEDMGWVEFLNRLFELIKKFLKGNKY